jgi:glycosyltransferase involved in cell wall biosynthesis
MFPLISVIVPVYKVEKYLDKCVQSILKQTYKNLEIILVDDGSPDRCPEMCDAYANNDSRVIVIHKKNEGLSAARNTGLDIAKGEYIGFVDSDDWIAPDMYEHLVNGFLQNEDVGITSVCINCMYENGNKNWAKSDDLLDRRLTASEWIRLLSEASSRYNVWNRLYLARLAKQVSFAYGKFAQDVKFNFQIAEFLEDSGLSYLDLPYFGYFYNRDRPGNISNQGIQQDIDVLSHYISLYKQWNESRPDWAELVKRRRTKYCVDVNSRIQLISQWRHLCRMQELDLREISNCYVLANFSKHFILSFFILKYMPFFWRNDKIRRWSAEFGMRYV